MNRGGNQSPLKCALNGLSSAEPTVCQGDPLYRRTDSNRNSKYGWRARGEAYRVPQRTLMWQEARAQCSPPMFWKSKWVFYSHFLPSSWILLNLYFAESNYSFPPSFSWQLEKVKLVLLSFIVKLLSPVFCNYSPLKKYYWDHVLMLHWEGKQGAVGPSCLIPPLPPRRHIHEWLWERCDLSACAWKTRGLPVPKISLLNFRMTDSAPLPPPQLIRRPTVQGDGIKIWGLWGD